MFKLLLVSALLFFLGYGIFSFFADKLGAKNRKTNSYSKKNNTQPQEDKKFSKNIGEYVDYEEVKDDDLRK